MTEVTSPVAGADVFTSTTLYPPPPPPPPPPPTHTHTHTHTTPDTLGIAEPADRVKILQQITTMRADLIPTSFSPTKRTYSPIRMRRFSETARPVQRGGSGRVMRHTTSASTLDRTLSPTKTPVRESRSPRVTSPSYFSDQTSIDSPGSSRMSSPVKLMAKSPMEARMHFILETDEEEGEGVASGCVLRANAGALRDHHKRLSRSLDGLLQVCTSCIYYRF